MKFQSVQELSNSIENYFAYCLGKARWDDGTLHDDPALVVRPTTISGLALWLDTTRDLLLDYEEKDEFSDTIKRAKLRIMAFNEEKLYDRNIPTAGVIFNLTNNYGWQNKFNQDVTSKGEKISGIAVELVHVAQNKDSSGV